MVNISRLFQAQRATNLIAINNNDNEAREREARAFFFLDIQGKKFFCNGSHTRVGCLVLSFSVCVWVLP